MKIKGAVFDLDGILIDTEGLQYLGWVEALRPHGVVFTKEEYFDYAGRKRLEIDAALIKKYNLSIPPGSLAEAKNKRLFKWFAARKLPLVKGALEILSLFKRRGVRVAAISNCRRKELELKLAGSGLGKHFKICICFDDVERPKPHPDLYLRASEMLNLEPAECLALEDTQAGVESAKAAGLFCIAIPNEYTRGQDFSKADLVFNSLTEAIDLIKSGESVQI